MTLIATGPGSGSGTGSGTGSRTGSGSGSRTGSKTGSKTGAPSSGPPAYSWPSHVPRRIPRRRLLGPTWPLTLLLVGFPLLWALGLAAFAVQVTAVPMAWELLRRRPVRVPAWFGVWCLFLLFSLVGLVVLGDNPPGTVPDSVPGRLIGYGTRETGYLAATVVLLYVGNLTAAQLSERRLVNQLCWFFVAVTLGGVLGLVFPHFSFTSPLEQLLPVKVSSSTYVNRLIHPALAQVQEFGGDPLPRPSAPFAYTNTWGSQISLLAVWFVVGWLLLARGWRRVLAPVLLVTAVVTVVYSLNRGVWIGVAFTVGYVLFAPARRGRFVPLAGVLIAVVVGGVVLLQSPLHSVVDTRAQNPKSDAIRGYTSARAFELANRSPIVGYGSTRSATGSQSSIAVGKSAACPTCGNVPIGINGSFFTLIVTTGYAGCLLFFGFWFTQAWRSRHDRSVIGAACQLTLLLAVLYSFFYTVELVVPFLAMALMWRRRTGQGGDDAWANSSEPDPAAAPRRPADRVRYVAPADRLA